ncbi:hypothetical protein A3A20_00530 [Candidatus Wolfebacteria bacterium RIFCSPLOWO2_01_FULL_45_19]|uniref:Translation elongation factor-like protein n=1 Tax=Candidatus Wolfebacteria bacterium RIFCSPLOWO2_01_FULL_45_19 TaxID=1802557 RepID=A0A1F8DR15_9BACT|nr:MAG: hypothetical protein UX23_C0006G0025 [Parcubacteria group bacterium GW2011_GWB1_45_9]OGM91067.1 MAG: hypothetical protein A3A20_00530 [Candidatus Wolfebacteria bacterium RIFCSPLOWO2_01_FULL_45_19]
MPKTKEPKPIGEIKHYYGGIGVAVIKFGKAVKVGDRVSVKGATSDFEETISSMQYDHKEIKGAKKGQEVGVKISKKVREGDKIYEIK